MSRIITVKVVDAKGYGLSGYEVKVYGRNTSRTDRDGEAVVEASGSQVSIYANGRTEYSGSVADCKSPLAVQR
jgi:hypothetical protein